ncbi:MAG: response regulator [Ignavibacteria bacterium]|nr:response regulator [Ignavibacteria bacterium]
MRNEKLNILVVEDNHDNREVISLFIRGSASLDFATNGEEALVKTDRNLYDIILMDINLGAGMDGIAVTQEIRKMPIYSDTPIIAVTAYAMNSDKERFLSGGCSHYLAKPFARQEILKLILPLLTLKI